MALPTIFPMGYVTRCGFNYLLFSTLLGGSNSTNIFQLDWNYQQLGGFCRKQKSCQCLFWCDFCFQKNRKNHYQNNLKYVLGKLRRPQTNRRLRFPMKCWWWNVARDSLPKMLSRFCFFELESFAQLISYDLQDFNYPSTVLLHWKWPFRLRIFAGQCLVLDTPAARNGIAKWTIDIITFF